MKKRKILNPVIMAVAFLFLIAGIGQADTPAPGEESLFTTSTAPDALFLLDLSGSMVWNPAGGDETWGNTSCSGTTFYSSSRTGYTTICSRLAIAKRAIFNVLDDNNDGTVNSSDEGSLGVRLGYMRYYNCSSDDTAGSYTSGCIQIPGTSTSRRYIGSKFSQIYCNSSTSCTIGSTGSYAVGGESATGGTPLGSALNEAKLYLDAHKAADSAKACRQKFVILLTDGSDTYSCGADGSECNTHRYKNRREVVAKAKVLADTGYKVFVIGFGSTMPSYLQNTLNWMAYYGGTDNPNVANSVSTPVYNPSAVTSCAAETSTHSSDNETGYPYCVDSVGNNNISNFYATANDPGTMTISGYAFIAGDADQLATALKTAISIIKEATYSFSQASVQSSRTQDENYLYEGSFQPITGDPFWFGHLKKYQINDDGTVGSVLWDAGTVLQSRSYSTRTIKTYSGGALVDFNTTNMTTTLLGVATTAERDAIVGYFQGNPAYNQDNWKLGDVFRSTPITVGTPSIYFDDMRDAGNAFAVHRAS
jgi:hypothetical protein